MEEESGIDIDLGWIVVRKTDVGSETRVCDARGREREGVFGGHMGWRH